jgi:hypothetical protein
MQAKYMQSKKVTESDTFTIPAISFNIKGYTVHRAQQ